MSRTLKDSTGREVMDLEFDGKGKESFLARATYVDDGSDVPEDELNYIGRYECFCWACRESA